MDSLFQVSVLNQTPDPERVIYQAMHQDYSSEFVTTDHKIPAKYGEIIVKALLEGHRGHYGPLEHPQISFACGFFPHSVMQQARTHRVGVTFDVQCLGGDTEVTFVRASGQLRKIPIADLYDRWTNGEKAIRERRILGRNAEPPGSYRRDCKTRLKKMRLRVLNEDTGVFEIGHIQDVMCSGLQPVYRLTLADGKTLDCTSNHRLYTSQGWQHMGDALGLVVDTNHQVLAVTQACELMTNGIVRTDALYSQKSWLKAQIDQGYTARHIAEHCKVSPETISYWASQHSLKLPSAYRKGRQTTAGNGLYRNKDWLQTQLNQGLHIKEIATLSGCSIEAVKKWIYAYGLTLNKRSPGLDIPWNKGVKGYKLTLTAESLEQRRANAKAFTRRGADSHFWKGGTSTGRELIGAWICQRCGRSGGYLHAHHLVPVFADESLAYEFGNLASLCKPCHEHLHHNHLKAEFAKNFQPILEPKLWATKRQPVGRKLKAHGVKVVAVDYLGMQTTYDLAVTGPWHNFVANGVVVHNSFRYTGDMIAELGSQLLRDPETPTNDLFYVPETVLEGKAKTREGLTPIHPEALILILEQYRSQAIAYYRLVHEYGVPYEDARNVIGYGIRQHFVVSFNCRSLMHFLDLRAKEDAQREIRQLCELLLPHFEAWCPHIAAWYVKYRWGKARLSP